MQFLSRALPALVLFALSACSERDQWPDWEHRGHADLTVDIRKTSHTCSECVVLSPTTRITYRDGPGLVDESPYVVLDSLRRIWVGKLDGYIVYDSNGTFLTTVGRRGRGPLEFTTTSPLYTDDTGRVHIMDNSLYRETIVASDYSLHELRPLPVGPIYDIASTGSDRRMAVSGLFGDPARLGKPIHVLDSGVIVRSFGQPNDTSYSPTTVSLMRQLAFMPTGHLVAARRYEYDLEVYDDAGQRRLHIRRPDAWPSHAGELKASTLKDKLPGFVQDIAVDGHGRVWVLSMDPRSDWSKYARAVTFPNGEQGAMPTGSTPMWYRSRIEVIDLHTGHLEGSRITDTQLFGFLGPDRVYGYDYTPDGEPQFVMFRVGLNSTHSDK